MMLVSMFWMIDVDVEGPGGIFLKISRPQSPPTEGVDQYINMNSFNRYIDYQIFSVLCICLTSVQEGVGRVERWGMTTPVSVKHVSFI